MTNRVIQTASVFIVAYTRIEYLALCGVIVLSVLACWWGWQAFDAQRRLDRRLDDQAVLIGQVRTAVGAVRAEVAKIPKG